MTDVRVRNVDEWVIEWHRSEARRVGRTLEAELRRVITEAALDRCRAIVAEMRTDLNELQSKYGLFPDSVRDIRLEREQRG
jgi:plasmid stability protein